MENILHNKHIFHILNAISLHFEHADGQHADWNNIKLV